MKCISIKLISFFLFFLQSELISVCGKNLRVLVDMLQAIDLQEAFVSKRKSREIRRKSSSEFIVLILTKIISFGKQICILGV